MGVDDRGDQRALESVRGSQVVNEYIMIERNFTIASQDVVVKKEEREVY